jgi:hypothetical protein
MRQPLWKLVIAGLLAGFVGNGILGALFSSPPIQAVLYNPSIQSPLFIEVTPQRNVALSVAGLVVLSAVHSWLFSLLSPAVPGTTWFKQGLFWGLVIWLMYWLCQEWFVYHTLLGEPILLNLLELAILLVGSLVEGVVIAFVLRKRASAILA